jgi:hypothetical protein
MPHLWFQSEHVWNVFDLTESPVALLRDRPVPVSVGDEPAGVLAALHRRANGAWVLFTDPKNKARLNGLDFPGIRLLRDRDEIRVCGQTYFFSTERLAVIEEYTGSGKAFCPRCRQEMKNGTPAVQCPGCGVWYHEDGNLNCWRYADNCGLCPQKTPLIDTYQWTPEAV